MNLPTPALRALLQGKASVRSNHSTRVGPGGRFVNAVRAWAIRLVGAPILELQCPRCGSVVLVRIDRSGAVFQ